MRARHRLLVCALGGWAFFLCSCGYIGDPLPPSLGIPTPITDLTAVERGNKLVVQFTAPGVTNDGVVLRKLAALDVRAGLAGPDWDATAKPIEAAAPQPGPVRAEAAVAEWVGREIIVRARAAGRPGRYSDWSNAIRLKIVEPIEVPVLEAEAAANGVRLTWVPVKIPDAQYRVSKFGPEDQEPVLAATVKTPEYTDTSAEFGKTYRYFVQAFVPVGNSEAQSEPSRTVPITPEDTFPPAVPAGVHAIAGTSSIELTWNPDTEPDLRGYYVYRSAGGGEPEKVGELVTAPAYSDRAIESGKRYRYSVSAIDVRGNESARSAPVEAAAP